MHCACEYRHECPTGLMWMSHRGQPQVLISIFLIWDRVSVVCHYTSDELAHRLWEILDLPSHWDYRHWLPCLALYGESLQASNVFLNDRKKWIQKKEFEVESGKASTKPKMLSSSSQAIQGSGRQHTGKWSCYRSCYLHNSQQPMSPYLYTALLDLLFDDKTLARPFILYEPRFLTGTGIIVSTS